MSERIDAVIIGAGAEGVAAARLFASEGKQVMIFDGVQCVCAETEATARATSIALALDEPVLEIRTDGTDLLIRTPYDTYRATAVLMP